MTLSELKQYTYLRSKIKQFDEEINYLRHIAITDTVAGSDSDFPYSKRTFKIKGADKPTAIRIQELKDRRTDYRQRKAAIEAYIDSIRDLRTQEIFEQKFIYNRSWLEVARRTGGRNTADSVRKTCRRYIDRHK